MGDDVRLDVFLDLVTRTPGIGRSPNPEQEICVRAAPDVPTMIVAGPGSGKTTVLVLRALRHILVDQISPERIVITTFTIKAAREIRSRLIEWGEALLETAEASTLDGTDRAFLATVDINRVVTGTLDSICQEALGSDRHADEPPLVTLEGFAASMLLQRRGGLGAVFEANKDELANFLAPFTHDEKPPRSLADVAKAVTPIIERLVQDRVDVAAFGASDQPLSHQLIAQVANAYRQFLRENNLLDFSSLEEALLNRIIAGRVPALLAGVGAVLVDEYQDTNALQEAIYFALVSATAASFTVVGDDDQSLYRFRGATIELFRAFIERCETRLGRAPTSPLYLVENYRSTEEIVKHFNDFVRRDANFLPARIDPPKPEIKAKLGASNMPVLAMFRPDSTVLANDLANFLHGVFRDGGWRDPDGLLPEAIRGSAAGGDLGDAVLLGFSVQEIQRPYFENPPKPKFPHDLRAALASRGLSMFNPRGRSLRDIEEVERLLGLVLLTIDPPDQPGGSLFQAMTITKPAKYFMSRWIDKARAFLGGAPADIYRRSIRDEMGDWRDFLSRGQGRRRSGRDWPFLDVIYGLTPWIPYFENDPEGQVYLEAISRAAGQAAGFSAYGGKLLRPDPTRETDHSQRSLEAIIRDVLAPIAENVIDVDEEIMPSVPRDRLNVMTIHQAKGLEYPLVIVDVGADFKKDAPLNRFRRFPEKPSATARAENLLAPFTPELGPLRTARSELDRSFEDLIRLYYVAFSRPQSVLMLVGCSKSLSWGTNIKHVATGWRQDWSWAWREATPNLGRKPPAYVTPPSIVLV